jgi:hypothetical protein
MELVDFTVAGVAPVAPLVAFDRLVQHDISTVFQGYLGVLPGVTTVSHQSGPWNHPGERRTVHLSDGSEFVEEITRFVRPETSNVHGQFDYRTTGYTKRLGHLVSDARVSWRYEPLGAATRIRLTYGFRPLPGRRFVVMSVIGPIWVRYMRRVMADCVAVAAGS